MYSKNKTSFEFETGGAFKKKIFHSLIAITLVHNISKIFKKKHLKSQIG